MGTTGSEMTMPPFEVILGMIGIVLFGIILGALIMLPIVQKKSNYPLEVLSGDLIWRYFFDIEFSARHRLVAHWLIKLFNKKKSEEKFFFAFFVEIFSEPQ